VGRRLRVGLSIAALSIATGCASNAEVAPRARSGAAVASPGARAPDPGGQREPRDPAEREIERLRLRGHLLEAELWLSRAQARWAARRRAAATVGEELVQELARTAGHRVQDGDVLITVRDGRMYVVLPDDVLFASGSAEVTERGQRTLATLAGSLRTFDARLEVAGHTDEVPIARGRFASNWELSAARAIAVVRILVRDGVDPRALSATAFAEFDPAAPNDSAAGRATNRRIEILVMPNVDDIEVEP
jgi:chemotaxis protein MotB